MSIEIINNTMDVIINQLIYHHFIILKLFHYNIINLMLCNLIFLFYEYSI